MRVLIVFITIIAAIGLSAVYLLDSWDPTPPTIPIEPSPPSPPTDPTPPSTPPPEPYDGGPIIIKGDDQFTLTNGVIRGSGTQSDPYIIEGWNIDVSNCDTSVWPYIKVGIIISGTSEHFVVRNCQVVNAETDVGVSLSVNFGRVEDCVIKNSYSGISVGNSFNVTISGNTIESCEHGISGGSYSSYNVDIMNNTITGCADVGIDFFNLHNSSATGNRVNYNFEGIRVTTSANCTISYNTVQGNELEGMDVSYSGWKTDNNLVSYNDVSNNGGTGIAVYGSHDSIIYNTVNGNGGSGITLDFIGLTDVTAGNNMISNNEANNNVDSGIYLGSGCVQNTVSNNICLSNNADNEYYDDGSPRYSDIEVWAMPNTLENNTYGTILIYSP